MASRTQLRVQQLTGSIIDIAYSGSVSSAAQPAAITDAHLGSLLGEMAGAIGRISGKAGTGASAFTNNAAGTFYHTLKSDSAGNVDLGSTTDADKFGDIFIADGKALKLGNAEEHSINDSGDGLSIDSSEAIQINSSTATISIGNDNVNQNINIGTDGQREITIGDASAANSAGLTLRANTGGIDIDCSQATGDLSLDTAGGAIEIGVNAAAGNISIGTNATARNVAIGNTTGATGVAIDAGTGGIALASTGTGDIEIDSDDTLLLDSDGVLELNSSGGAISIGNDAVAQAINIGTGAAARTITIGNITGATGIAIKGGTGNVDLYVGEGDDKGKVRLSGSHGADSVNVLSDATFDADVTITGNLVVNGSQFKVDGESVVLDDSLMELATVNKAAPGSTTATKDKGLLLHHHDGSSASLNFIGFDSTNAGGKFTFKTGVTDDGDGSISGGSVATVLANIEGSSTLSVVTDSTANTAFPVVFHDESNALLDSQFIEINPSAKKLQFVGDDAADIASLSIDANAALTIQTDDAAGLNGNITLDADGDIILDAAGDDFEFKKAGTSILKISDASSDVVFQPQVANKDIIFKEDGGDEVFRVDSSAKDLLFAAGNNVSFGASTRYIGDGTDFAAASANDLVLQSSNELYLVPGSAGKSIIAMGAGGGSVDFIEMDTGENLLIITASAGNAILSSSVDNKDIIFHGNDATEIFRLDSSRQALVFKDDMQLGFGNGFDASFKYDETTTDTLLYDGASLRISDDTKLEFGSDGDASIEYDEDGDNIVKVAGSNWRFFDSATGQIQFRDSGLAIGTSGDGKLVMDADGNVEIAAPFVELNNGDNNTPAQLRFVEDSDNGSHYVGLRAAASLAGNVEFTLPTADATSSGQALISDGAGNLSFSDVGGAAGKRHIFNVTQQFDNSTPAAITMANATAGIELLPGADDTMNITVSDAKKMKQVEVYVNGQLLVSGSENDYVLSSATQLTFAFNLEVDDVIQVIERK